MTENSPEVEKLLKEAAEMYDKHNSIETLVESRGQQGSLGAPYGSDPEEEDSK